MTYNYSKYYEDYKNLWKKYSGGSGTTVEQVTTTPKRTKEQEAALERIKKTMLFARNKFVDSVYAAEAEADTEQNIYFPAKGGLYVKTSMHVGGNNIQVVEKVKECALLEDANEGIKELTINNKIPADLIKEIIGSFNIIYKDSGDEAAAQIYKKRGTDEYFIYYPEQKISKASVSYPDDPKIQTLRTENELVCELHSHNSMSAFWSGIDDANENEVCFYVVLGTFDKDVTYKARVKCNSFQKDLKLSDIFALTEEEEKAMLKKENIGPGNPEIKTKVTKNASSYAVAKGYYCSEYLTNPYYGRYYETGTYVNKYSVSNRSTESKKEEKETQAPQALRVAQVTPAPAELLEDIEIGTMNYLESMSFDYNAANVNNSDIIRFFDARDMVEVRDDIGIPDAIDYTNGYNLINTYNTESLIKNMDARAHAYLLKTYISASSYDLAEDSDLFNSLYTADGFKIAALTLNSTDVVNNNWNLIAFWEGLSKYQKALISNVFDQNVLFISQFIHDHSETNYYFIDFLAHIIHAPEKLRREYIEFIEDVITNFASLVDDADEGDSEYESLSMLEKYFEVCLDEHLANGGVISIDELIFNSRSEAALVNEFSSVCNDTDDTKVIELHPATEEQTALFK